MTTQDDDLSNELVQVATQLAAQPAGAERTGPETTGELTGPNRQRIKAALLAKIGASSPEGTTTIKSNLDAADAPNWEPFLEGVTRKVLLKDDELGLETALYRLQPGFGFPEHEHTHTEECWVLEGEVRVGDYAVCAGDMHIAHKGYTHDPVIATTDTVLLIRSQPY